MLSFLMSRYNNNIIWSFKIFFIKSDQEWWSEQTWMHWINIIQIILLHNIFHTNYIFFILLLSAVKQLTLLFWNKIKLLIINKFHINSNLICFTNKILILCILTLTSTTLFTVSIFILSLLFFFISTYFLSYFLKKNASDTQITRISLKK